MSGDRWPTWVDGHLVPADRAAVDVADHGFTLGDGLFETLRAVDGRPAFWPRHMDRLRRGLATLGLRLDRSDDELRHAVGAVLDGRPGPARVRITVTSGPSGPGPTRGPGPCTVVVTAGPLAPPPASLRAVTSPWVRNERSPLAGVKSTSFGAGVVQLADARARQADEAVLCDTRGRVSEAVTANVLVGIAGVLLTPGLAAGCLPGIVRAVLLDSGVVAEADLPAEVLATADELALTSSTRGVVPVAQLDGRSFDQVPGPLTSRAAAAFDTALAVDLAGDPPPDWPAGA